MFGINGAELIVLLVIAVVVVGPERLPRYAEQLGAWVRSARGFVGTARERVATELGEEAADVDWASLDPRRYDPRRIVREALLDDGPVTGAGVRHGSPTAYRAGSAGTQGVAGAGAAGVGAAVVGSGASTAAHGPDGVAAPGAAAPSAPFDDEAT